MGDPNNLGRLSETFVTSVFAKAIVNNSEREQHQQQQQRQKQHAHALGLSYEEEDDEEAEAAIIARQERQRK